MANSGRQQVLVALQMEAAEGLGGSFFEPIAVGRMSPELALELTRQVAERVDQAAVMKAVSHLCLQYRIDLAESHRLRAVFRSMTVVAHARRRAGAQQDDDTDAVTAQVIRLLPFTVSEMLIATSVAHSTWDLIVHAPAVTLIPTALEELRRERAALMFMRNPRELGVVNVFKLRESREFTYAVGRLVRELQTMQVPFSATHEQGIALGNSAMALFQQFYEQALSRDVDFLSPMALRDIQDGQRFVSKLHLALHASAANDALANEPSTTSLDPGLHPVITTALACELALEDAGYRAHLHKLLSQALESLSPKQRSAWYFRRVERLSDEEASRAMNVSKNTFREHLKRAISRVEHQQYVEAVQQAAKSAAVEDQMLFADLMSLLLSREACEALEAPLKSWEHNAERQPQLAKLRTRGGNEF